MTTAAAAHALPVSEVAARLAVTCDTGLLPGQVTDRRKVCGANRLPEAPARTAIGLLTGQFGNVLILVLIAAALLAALIGDYEDALVILAVVVVNALVGFYQEYRAERSLAELKGMLPVRARVRRGGKPMQVAAEELLPGDVALLEAGDRVPADGRLLVAAGLEIDESSLTGESQVVGKQIAALARAEVPLAERTNMVYMNTLVTRGRAEFLITAIGVGTETGRVSQELVATTEAPTPLQLQLDRLGKRLGVVVMLLVLLLASLELLRGTDAMHVAMDAIALAVAAMPEGLPVVVTVTLALGMRGMARQRAIVKRLSSVETLGCTTVICSDKTGTLTLNQMTARVLFYRHRRYDIAGEGYGPSGAISAADGAEPAPDLDRLLTALVACNDSRILDGRVIGDPMEGALLVAARKGGAAPELVAGGLPRIAEIPFDAAHRFMATFHRERGYVRLYVKGAPDVLLERCERTLHGQDTQPLDADSRQVVAAQYAELAQRGLRGLLIATRTLDDGMMGDGDDLHRWISGLTFVGLVGLVDPLRPEARAAIAQCRQAGIAVKMITGDHPATATAIATELGLEGRSMTGAELDRLAPNDLAAMIDGIGVFARVTPAHKISIVRALQAQGHIVAMTGDGVNDAPALKGADIGVAMGQGGTAVAKAAATMVLADDNFATLVSAVRQGRVLYDNILKFVRFQMSTSIGAMLTVFLAPLLGLPEPFTAVQILWVAIIMDGPPAISLALDAARPGIMTDPPRRRSESVLPLARLWRILGFGAVMALGTLAVLRHGVAAGWGPRALTLAFTTFVLFQFFNVFNARAEQASALSRHSFANRMLWASLTGMIALQAVAVSWGPAQDVFRTTRLPPGEWGWHPRMSSRLGLYRLVQMPGSHEAIFTNPALLADKFVEAGRD